MLSKYVFTFFVLWVGWPSSMSIYFLSVLYTSHLRKSIRVSPVKLPSNTINLNVHLLLTQLMAFVPNLAHVFLTTGVFPFSHRVFPLWRLIWIMIHLIEQFLYFLFLPVSLWLDILLAAILALLPDFVGRLLLRVFD